VGWHKVLKEKNKMENSISGKIFFQKQKRMKIFPGK
jgi:hypothetical protein